jgi:hypothetical protein
VYATGKNLRPTGNPGNSASPIKVTLPLDQLGRRTEAPSGVEEPRSGHRGVTPRSAAVDFVKLNICDLLNLYIALESENAAGLGIMNMPWYGPAAHGVLSGRQDRNF